MSLQYARSAAGKLLETVPDDELPIDVESIAQSLNVPVLRDQLEPGVSGLLITRGGRATIFVNKKEEEKRQRFSIAHELGHFVLKHYAKSGDHVHVDKGVRVMQRGLKSSQGVDLVEIEANQFAASLLMPAQRVRQWIERREDQVISDSLIEDLATDFSVSIQAMTIRLNSLGLVQ